MTAPYRNPRRRQLNTKDSSAMTHSPRSFVAQVDPTTASTLIAVARAAVDVGRELDAGLLHQLEVIADDDTLAEVLRRDAMAIVETERGA